MSKGKAAGVLRLVFHDAGTFELSENSGIQGTFNVFVQFKLGLLVTTFFTPKCRTL